MGVPEESSATLVVSLPAGFKYLHTPGDFTITHSCLSAQSRSTVMGSVWKLSFTLRRTCTEIAVEDYSAFRDRIRDAAANLREALTFTQRKSAR
jgi:hypothetical protein